MQGDAPPLPPSKVFHDLRGESAAAGAAFYDMILAPSTVGGFSSQPLGDSLAQLR